MGAYILESSVDAFDKTLTDAFLLNVLILGSAVSTLILEVGRELKNDN